MSRLVGTIAARLSLRPPQREALEVLARIVALVPPTKQVDPATALAAIGAEFPTVTSFERDFPSVCFALATGVGKTRLMGAFVAYLHSSLGINHFLVLAPNLTIYDKLMRDFSPNTPKYVLQGLGEFGASPPEIITGDNYEARAQTRGLFGPVEINVFNISKMSAEVRGDRRPRIKRFSECIGRSYFDYLAGLDDLVVLMDESHRYRADAGVRVINELKPVLGLEVTATPTVERGTRSERFENVIYEYALGQAIKDGFVKEPAVSTRANLNLDALTTEEIDKLKLEDGILLHEYAKTELQLYADRTGQERVKPFMLVIAQDTSHAAELQNTMEDETFLGGRYRGRIIQVHSNQRGEERDETIQRLLQIESRDEPTEIVIHVNMLKEGWDVTNLYTIVPLRAANSRVLVEQSIGRGLRLPYGRRTGVAAVDRLTIVAHDRFNEIIADAQKPDSNIRTGIVIGRDVPDRPATAVSVPTVVEHLIRGDGAAPTGGGGFSSAADREVAAMALEVIQEQERVARSADLQSPQVQAQIVEAVTERLRPQQGVLPDLAASVDAAAVVALTTRIFVERSIDIPKVVVQPVGVSHGRYDRFAVELTTRWQPVSHDILVQHLGSQQQDRLRTDQMSVAEGRLEDYVVAALVRDDVSYDENADLLYDLAGQVLAHLRTYLDNDDDVRDVLQYYQRQIGDVVHAQMQRHFTPGDLRFDERVTRGFIALKASTASLAHGERVRDFRDPLAPTGTDLRGMVFGGFSKCVYVHQTFHSLPEWRLAASLENDPAVQKWVKPGRTIFQIHYGQDSAYEPDFVVEMETEKLLCEVKASGMTPDEVVRAKALAARRWCACATQHALEHGAKPWSYVLLPHDEIQPSRTFSALLQAHRAVVA